jgi:glycosyltransferase involved in cell wall biosynthesis
MRVLILSQYYWPEPFLINDVVDSLRAEGCDVTVLTGQPNYPDGLIFPGHSAWGFGTEHHPAGYEIHRVPVAPRGTGGLRRVLNYASFILSASLLGPWLTRGRQFDVVFVYAVSPILQGLPGIVYRRLKGAALVIWVQDLWPDSLQSTGFVTNPRILAAVRRLTRFIYHRSDLLLAQSRGFVDRIRELAGPTRIVFHPNPGQDTAGKGDGANLDLGPGFNVVFAGNLGTAQALETILKAAELIDDPNIRLVLVGTGSRSQWLQEQISQRRIGNLTLAGRFPTEAMPAIFAQASALLVTLNRSENLALTIPSKIPSYLAASRPIIASLDGEAADVVNEAKAGYAVPAEDAVALAGAIEAMAALAPADRESMGRAGRQYFDEHFAPRILTRAMIEQFRQAIEIRRGISSTHSLAGND